MTEELADNPGQQLQKKLSAFMQCCRGCHWGIVVKEQGTDRIDHHIGGEVSLHPDELLEVLREHRGEPLNKLPEGAAQSTSSFS